MIKSIADLLVKDLTRIRVEEACSSFCGERKQRRHGSGLSYAAVMAGIEDIAVKRPETGAGRRSTVALRPSSLEMSTVIDIHCLL